ERVKLEHALNRVLAEDVIADSDLPPFDRAQMDGYAVRAGETVDAPVRLRIVGESAAGRGWHHELKEGEAVRIMTGAPGPAGADIAHQGQRRHDLKTGPADELLNPVELGRSIVKRGAEITAGETFLQSGSTINAAMVAVLPAFGSANFAVGQRPRAGLLAT